MSANVVPTLREERRLLRAGHCLVAGMDEVGRGALAGPVSVGVVVVDAGCRSAPSGVRDSKLLTPAARQALAPRLRQWGVARAVGHAEPAEIDRIGIIAGLRLAANRALATLPRRPDCVILDGSHDWLTWRPWVEPAPQLPALFDLPAVDLPAVDTPVRALLNGHSGGSVQNCPRDPAQPVDAPAMTAAVDAPALVVTRVKADLRCAAVAAASVLAKVERDAIMVARAADFPGYGWELNKGYAVPEHLAALAELGPCPEHRQSWRLPVGPVLF